jgi:hypothetical protein
MLVASQVYYRIGGLSGSREVSIIEEIVHFHSLKKVKMGRKFRVIRRMREIMRKLGKKIMIKGKNSVNLVKVYRTQKLKIRWFCLHNQLLPHHKKAKSTTHISLQEVSHLISRNYSLNRHKLLILHAHKSRL